MDRVSSADARRRKRQLTVAVKDSLRQLNLQLSLLSHQVAARVEIRDVDLDCLDVVNRYGPLSPGALAQRTGLHRATMTGILDRLERGGWVVREPDKIDRRGVVVRALRDRNGELLRQFSGMNAAMDEVCASYDETELQVVLDFLRRTIEAGGTATSKLADG